MGSAPTDDLPDRVGSFGLVRSNRAFRMLCTARSLSYLGDALSLVALMLYVQSTTGMAIAVAVLLLVGDFVPALLGPVTGTVSDRFDRKRVMICCECVQAALMVVIAVWLPPLPVLLVLVALRSIAGQVFQPASRAVVPAVVADRDLGSANVALGFGTNVGEAVGPLLAGALFLVVDVRGVLLVDAATFVLSAILLAQLPPSARPVRSDAERTSFWQDTRAGLAYISATPLLRTIGLGFFAIVAFNGIDDVALVFLAADSLGAAQSSAAILLAAVGVGLLVGYAVVGSIHRMGMVALLLAGFAISSAGNLLTGLAWGVAAAFAVQSVRGVGIAAMDVAVNTLVQRNVPHDLLGRVFGTLYGAIGVAAALAYLLGGVLIDSTNPRVAFLVAGTGGLLTSVVVAATLRRTTARPLDPPPHS